MWHLKMKGEGYTGIGEQRQDKKRLVLYPNPFRCKVQSVIDN